MNGIKIKYVVAALSMFYLAACETTPDATMLGEAKSSWDFDHKLQYKKTQFDDTHYQLEVITNNKVGFERMSGFLLRRSYLICGGYSYSLTFIKGVESFDFKRQSPNLIRSNLVAKLDCLSK
jgi:hypothetical protein